jgi:spore germination cell wall hydrolase CwlJ-like protein
VVLNRIKTGKRGDTIKEVVTFPWQFEPWMTRQDEMVQLSTEDPRYQDAAKIVDAVLAGQMEDPTAGATNFLSTTIARERRGGSLPSWAVGEGQKIGRHAFYRLNQDDAAIETTKRAISALADSDSCSHLEAGQSPFVG